jgi:hypothetical protein
MQTRVLIALETLLLDEVLRPLAGKDDQLASYGMQSFAHLVAQRLNPS